jgi:hypothetical protein
MKLLESLAYSVLGPFWPEYLVARDLRNKGWTVFRHFNCYDPDKGRYAEIDVLAVSSDGFIIVEVKSYAGEWQCLDHHRVPTWLKVTSQKRYKSPVWQVKNARLALVNSIRRAYPQMKAKILDACLTYVFLDRGTLINAREPAVQKAWTDMHVHVLSLKERHRLPQASHPPAEAFLNWLNAYHSRYRWRWYFKPLHRMGLLDRHMRAIAQGH